MKTCQSWKTCPCDCHTLFDQMFAMSGMTRISVDNSGYVRDHGGFRMPSPEERLSDIASSIATGGNTVVAIESPAPGTVPPIVRRSFGATVTGRAARGGLESWVESFLDAWVIAKIGREGG